MAGVRRAAILVSQTGTLLVFLLIESIPWACLRRQPVGYLVDGNALISAGVCETGDRYRVPDLANTDERVGIPGVGVDTSYVLTTRIPRANTIAPGCRRNAGTFDPVREWTIPNWPNVPGCANGIGAGVSAWSCGDGPYSGPTIGHTWTAYRYCCFPTEKRAWTDISASSETGSQQGRRRDNLRETRRERQVAVRVHVEL